MKICFLNQNLNINTGLGRYGYEVVENISRQKGIEVIVLVETKSNHGLEKPILNKSYLLRNFLNIFINAIKARKYIKNCDIIHALDAYPYGVIASLVNIGLNKRLIINGVGTYSILPLDKFIKRYFLRWAYKRADKILCISKYTKDQILKRIKLNNIEVINLGVDYDKFQKNTVAKHNHSEKIILSVGVLKPRKGYYISIPAIAEVRKKYPQIKYYIVGGKPQKMYSDLVKNLNLEKNVEFLQGLSDEKLIELYHQSDIFLLTPVTINDNDFEGFGLVYLEAGACGKPVIGAYGSGAEDAIINNETGILIPQKDIKKTAEAVLKLLDNPELAKKLGENGRNRAWEMSWNNVAKKYIEIYESN